MECKNCCYFWYDDDGFGSVREFCHWESRCPDDIPPCEETAYIPDDYYGDEYEREISSECERESLDGNWW